MAKFGELLYQDCLNRVDLEPNLIRLIKIEIPSKKIVYATMKSIADQADIEYFPPPIEEELSIGGGRDVIPEECMGLPSRIQVCDDYLFC